mmetsp:Transcript_20190/g.64415  ORF Transcript_20190/g.64415 Transcript_20190/m.64415 type:complete len:265 (+) Transcript_20190:585-1379(+)
MHFCGIVHFAVSTVLLGGANVAGPESTGPQTPDGGSGEPFMHLHSAPTPTTEQSGQIRSGSGRHAVCHGEVPSWHLHSPPAGTEPSGQLGLTLHPRTGSGTRPFEHLHPAVLEPNEPSLHTGGLSAVHTSFTSTKPSGQTSTTTGQHRPRTRVSPSLHVTGVMMSMQVPSSATALSHTATSVHWPPIDCLGGWHGTEGSTVAQGPVGEVRAWPRGQSRFEHTPPTRNSGGWHCGGGPHLRVEGSITEGGSHLAMTEVQAPFTRA